MRALQVGDIAPRLVHPDASGSVFDLGADHVSGKFLAIVFCQGDMGNAAAALEEFASVHDGFQASGAGIVGVCSASARVEGEPERRSSLPFPVLVDVDAAIFRAYGLQTSGVSPGMSTVTVLLRPNGHVLDILSGDSQAAAALSIITRSLDTNSVLVSSPQPPVLIVPDVLSRGDCQDLMSVYQQSDAPFVHFSQVRIPDQDVKTQIPDYGRRDRIDHILNTRGIRESVARKVKVRVFPEIKKAFQYEVTGFEGLRIACYEGERQGKSHGHRDNSKPEVAHRRFAMSINLNSEEFSGGELRFPEYGPQLYKPDTGAAIAFSCSILHEALEVTRGKRFVFLTFLFGEK